MLHFLSNACPSRLNDPNDNAYRIVHEASPSGAVPPFARSCVMDLDTFLAAKPSLSSCTSIWVRCPARLGFASEFAKAAKSWPCEVIPVAGGVATIEELMAAGVRHVGLKGNESSGLVGRESAGTLLCLFSGRGVHFSIWGGIGLPEAAAAHLATGVRSIVFESVHALCGREDSATAQRLETLGISHFREVARSLDHESGACIRVFDRGNSTAARELVDLEARLLREGTPDALQHMERRARERAVPLGRAVLDRNELLLLGPEAAFAGEFRQRFGSEPDAALAGFARAVREAWGKAPATIEERYRTERNETLIGCALPYIQGAMTWISDIPHLALDIARSGALPTLALGPRNTGLLDKAFGNLPAVMGRHPYALNILVLPENGNRDEQLAWIERMRPPFVTIAAGDPSFTRDLALKGIKVLCHVQDERLLTLAADAGAWGVILEGNEAGGHVGEQTTLALAQMAMLWKRRNPDSRPFQVVLAGGMASREAVDRAMLLGADLVQMGTAYLACREFVEHGALTPLYQRLVLEAKTEATCLSGQSVGLRVRSLRTPRINAILALEKDFEIGELSFEKRRAKLEELGAGSLLLAARGRDREGGIRDERFCEHSGQFMSGSAAGRLEAVTTLADLHAALRHDPSELAEAPQDGPSPGPAPGGGRIRAAVTGAALATALGNDPDTVWRRAAAGESGIVSIAPMGDEPDGFFRPGAAQGASSYCDVGGIITVDVRRQDIHLPPHEFRDLSESTRLTLWLAEKAVTDAGLREAGYEPGRIGVFVSQNSGEQAGALFDANLALRADWLLRLAQEEMQPTPEQLAKFRERLLEGRMRPGAGTMLGRLNCAAAGFICRRFGFSGPSHSTGAACAAGMAALFDAWTLIQNGIIDAAVVGGGEELYSSLAYAEFAAMGALARSANYAAPHLCSRPFDAERTGFVPSGGGAVIILEREDSARSRNAPCLGYITGMGAGTNSQGLVEPSAGVQLQAIRASFDGLDYGPDAVGLVECHATSTPSGDLEEGRALAEIYGPCGGTTLSAFKSQIGHTFGASGLVALIHGLWAMRNRTLPPTINHDHSDPNIALDASGLRILREPLEWGACRDGVRRFQVNAFGFGGACYVAQLEEPSARTFRPALQAPPGLAPSPASGTEPKDLEFDGMRFSTVALDGTTWRAGLSQPDNHHELGGLTAPPDHKQTRSLAKRGIHLAPPAAPAPLAIVCCGQGSSYPGMGRELYDTFPLVREGMERIAAASDWDMLALLDETDRDRIISTRWQQPYLLMLEYGIAHYLQALGLQPSLIAGHSLGELIALCLAGVYTPETAWRVVNTRGRIMNDLETSMRSASGMLAVSADAGVVEDLVRRRPGLSVCNYNSPRQFILGGASHDLDDLAAELKQRRIPGTRLGVSMAFHHKGMRTARSRSLEALLPLPYFAPKLPVLSNVTTLPYPGDPAGIREHILDLDENPVRWTECVRRMWGEYGVRHFVEIGPASTLCGLIEDIEPDALCMATCRKRKEADALRSAVARLYALGHLRTETLRQASSRPTPAPNRRESGEDSPAPMDASGRDERTERIMSAIMKATGYERHELDTHMDLRADLGIRSIHFPVLLQELEKETGRKIGFDQLIGVSTIEDLSIVLGSVEESREAADSPPTRKALPVLRYGFELAQQQPDEDHTVIPDHSIVVAGERELADTLAELLRKAGVSPCTAMTIDEAVERPLTEQENTGCLVFAVQGTDPDGNHMAGFVRLLQAHLSTHPTGCSALLIGAARKHALGRTLQTDPTFEGMAALLLSAAQEHPTCRFRSVWLDDGITTSVHGAALLQRALFDGEPSVQRVVTRDSILAPRLTELPVDPDAQGLPVKRGDVIIVSGGSGGIIPHAVSELAGFEPTLILLGKSDRESILPVLESDAWSKVRLTGANTEYHSCDIRDAESVRRVMEDIVARHGRIDGLIHAAGITDNGPLLSLSRETFLSVQAVKCLGLRNLLASTAPAGLRYTLALSSLAAWFGSFSQSGYAAANRAMSAILEAASVPSLTLWLPPISGAGMAENEVTRSAMSLKGMDDAWIGAHELGDLVARETLHGGESAVLLARHLPTARGVLSPLHLPSGTHTPFTPPRGYVRSTRPVRLHALPLSVCESIVEYSGFRDLWIADHRPWQELEHPLLSAIMELDALFSGALHLTPWRIPVGARDAAWLKPVFCPEGITREGRITATGTGTPGECSAMLEIRDVTPTWRIRDSWSKTATASILTATAPPRLSPLWAEPDETMPCSIDRRSMQGFYCEKTAFGERYRVLDSCEYQPENRAKTVLTYPALDDSTVPGRAHSYPAYLLEAAFQLSAIAAGRKVLPVGLKSLLFSRHCDPGEALEVEVRIAKADAVAVTANAQCRDSYGNNVMTIEGILLAVPEIRP